MLNPKSNRRIINFILKLLLKQHHIKLINQDEANMIIETRLPLGRFLLKGNSLYVGVDNSTGDSWVEEFAKIKDCINWLNGGDFISDDNLNN